jgi:hypothetical protein
MLVLFRFRGLKLLSRLALLFSGLLRLVNVKMPLQVFDGALHSTVKSRYAGIVERFEENIFGSYRRG